MSVCAHLPGQHTGWCLEAGSGVESGWWLHRHGTTDLAIPNSLSWSRTHLSPILPVDLALLHEGKKFTAGAGLSATWLLDDVMVGPSHSQNGAEYIPVADIAVYYTQFFAQAEYRLTGSPSGRYRFSPSLRLGSYLISTSHPQRNSFGFRYLVEAGVSNEILLKKVALVIRPQYMVMTLYPNPRNPGEIHKTYSFGVDASLRWYFKSTIR
jgi:hypothetical protein